MATLRALTFVKLNDMWSQERRLNCQVIPKLGRDNQGGGHMPVLILWAVPAVLVLGGGIYLIGHLH